MKPLVSVIIPMYNREQTIQRAVESVLNQTYSNIELIIVDDGSTDMSVKVVKKYLNNKVKLIVLPHNCGANAARNIGIKAAKGDYIALQDSDDEWLSDKLAIQIDYMLNNGYKVLFCPYTLYLQDDEAGQIPSMHIMQRIKEEGIKNILRKENIIGTPTLVIAREIIERVGLFDEVMPRMQEYEYIIRIVKKYDIGYVVQPLVNAYRQKESITNNDSAFYNAVEILFEKHGDFINIESLLRVTFQLSLLKYSENFSESIKNLRYLYAKKDGEKEKIFNEIGIGILGENYTSANRIEKKYIETKISQLYRREFAIYGSGKIAKAVYNKLRQSKLYPKFFIVSEKTKETEEYIDNIPVEKISDVKNKSIEVIVAVSIKYQEQILDNLSKWDFENYFIIDDVSAILGKEVLANEGIITDL